MEERIFEILFKEDEITWQALLYELVKTEQMDPWDVDISQLTYKYLDRIKKLKGSDLRISGKVLLAAAILLKIKSTKLMDSLSDFDDFLSGKEDVDIADEVGTVIDEVNMDKITPLIPRTPQPRARKVSIFELMDALQQALDVKRRRVLHEIPEATMEIPERKYDITILIKDMFGQIKDVLRSSGKVTFTQLVPADNKEAKVLTFVPLLHLSTQRKIDLLQESHFGEIEIKIVDSKGAQHNG